MVASPSSMDAAAPPDTFQMTGTGFSAAYGMPHVDLYDEFGNIVAQTYATYVSSDGTTMQVPGSVVSYLSSAAYGAVVKLVQSNGTLQALGGAEVDVYSNGSPPPPCDPGMVCE